MGYKAGPPSTTTTTQEPYGASFARDIVGADRYGQSMLHRYVDKYLADPAAYTYMGPRVADFTPTQKQAHGLISQLATNPGTYQGQFNLLQGGNFLGGAALDVSRQGAENAYINALAPTINGQMLSPEKNPYLAAYTQAAVDPIFQNLETSTIPNLRSTAALAGRGGSGAEADLVGNAAEAAGRAAGATAAGIYAPAYQQERELQMNAANVPLQFYQGQQQNALNSMNSMNNQVNQMMKQYGYLTSVGEEQQRLNQAQLTADQDLFHDLIYDPINLLSTFGNIAFSGGTMGGTGTTSTPGYYPSLGQSLLGGGMQIASLLPQIISAFQGE